MGLHASRLAIATAGAGARAARAHRQARDERGARAHVRVLAAGIIFDATVIRARLVPSITRLAGGWNRWMPKSLQRVLLVTPQPEASQPDSATAPEARSSPATSQ
jgi:uncharacterized membrane protein YdfJ with MMPL/SSD domain